MNYHTGFHEYKDGKGFNPGCPACQAEPLDYVPLEVLAKERDKRLVELTSILAELQILANLPSRLI